MKIFVYLFALLFFSVPVFSADYQVSELSPLDTYIQKSLPNQSFERENNLLISNLGSDEHVSFIKFNVNPTVNLSIEGRVFLILYNNAKRQNQLVESKNPPMISVSLLSSDMTNKVNWRNSLTSYKKVNNNFKIVTLKVEGDGYYTSIEITDYYKYWKLNPSLNKGLVLKSISGQGSHSFSSTRNPNERERPMLRLTEPSRDVNGLIIPSVPIKRISSNMCS